MTQTNNALPKAVLFDWDLTLVDTGETIFRAFNAMLVAMGREPWSKDYARINIQHSGREAMPALFGDRASEAEAIFYTNIQACHLEELKPLGGAKDLLAHLWDGGIPIGIVSNKRGDVLRQEVSHLGWGKWLSAVVGAGDAERDKPAADPILLALQMIGMLPSPDVWMIGDMPVDWACARSAGCWAISVGNHPEKANQCDFSVSDCHDLKKILLERNSFLGVFAKSG